MLGAFLEFAMIAHVISVNIPDRESLTARAGRITNSGTTTKHTDDIVFRIDGELPQYKYVDWYPNFHTAKRNIVDGNNITVHTIPGHDTIWSVVFDDGTSTSFEKMLEAKSQNKSLAKILAIAVPLLIAYGLFDIWRRKNRAR